MSAKKHRSNRPPGGSKPTYSERRKNQMARDIATGVANEMQNRMGVDFREHAEDHAWIRMQRTLYAEREAMRKKAEADSAQLHRDIKNALIVRFVIPGLALAFTTAAFGQRLLTKLFSWIAGHGFQ